MSLNLGDGISKYVVVRNASMRFQFSERVVFADLFVSRKTGNVKVDSETGEAVLKDGQPVHERVYTKWEGRFCGNALEAAKTLQNGQAINITQGWMEKDENVSKKTNRVYTNVYVMITDFELCTELQDNDGEPEEIEE